MPASRPALTKALLLLLLALSLSGCTTLDPQAQNVYSIQDRRDPGRQDDYYRLEREYIKERRKVANVPGSVSQIALAFSGGGIRSASFNLGVLQALEHENLLREMDYLSAVSGGAYIGAWYVSSLVPPRNGKEVNHLDQEGLLVASSNSRKLLLDPAGDGPMGLEGADPVAHLRGNTSFLLKNSGIGWPRLAFRWVSSLVPNLLFDVGLHFRPVSGKFNRHHTFYPYRSRIERTYLLDQETVPGSGKRLLHNINPLGSRAPYLIVNAALANHGSKERHRLPARASGWPHYDSSPFEFTRDYCGAPGIGYLPTVAFDKPVKVVDFDEDHFFPSRKFPARVKIKERPLPFLRPTADLPLSNAVTASGAAISPYFVGGGKRYTIGAILRFFNLNAHYDTRNFGQSASQGWLWAYDRVIREVIIDRFYPTVRSNSISISDGGHYDNLGIVALVKRRAPTILVFDASADSNYTYGSLRSSQEKVSLEGCSMTCAGYEWKFDPVVVADEEKAFPDDFMNQDPPDYVLKGSISCSCPQTQRMNVYYVKAAILPGGDEIPSYVRAFAANSSSFPHTTTFKQWYGWRRFEAYRQLGFSEALLLIKKLQNDRGESSANPSDQSPGSSGY